MHASVKVYLYTRLAYTGHYIVLNAISTPRQLDVDAVG